MQTKRLAFWPKSGRVDRERGVISLVIFRNKTIPLPNLEN